MRVLWFCNTPGLASQHLKALSGGGGWITALQKEVEDNSEFTLGYAFYNDHVNEKFEFGGTTYYPIVRQGNTKIKRLVNRIKVKVEYDECMPQFVNAVENFKPDIIHVHGTENPFGLIAKEIKDIPIVISIQGNLSAYKMKFFSGIPKPSGGMFDSKAFFLVKDYEAFCKKADIEREIFSMSKYIMGRTDWDRRITRVLAPNSKYYRAEEVIRPTFYNSRWSDPSNKTKTYFTTSSGSLYKGFETLLDSAIELKKAGHEFIWKVAGLSVTSDLVIQSLKSRGVKDVNKVNIQLLGYLNEGQILDHMLTSGVYIQVSHIENSPNSLCEAMLLGMPIISSYAGGSNSMVNDGECAILVQDGDPFSLGGAILELANDPEKAEELGTKAYHQAHNRHDPSMVGKDLVTTYREIIENENSSKK